MSSRSQVVVTDAMMRTLIERAGTDKDGTSRVDAGVAAACGKLAVAYRVSQDATLSAVADALALDKARRAARTARAMRAERIADKVAERLATARELNKLSATDKALLAAPAAKAKSAPKAKSTPALESVPNVQ